MIELIRSFGFVRKAAVVYESFSTRLARAIALLLLTVMFLLMYTVSQQESAAMDELAHIPAGYSYVARADMRLNPEHPPLLKDISGLPLAFLDLDFPDGNRSWTELLNGQWDMGREFLYRSGNDPDRILFWARLGPMLLTVLFGWFLFKFGSLFFGKRVGLAATLLFAFSPALLAHGKYVTTDVAAAFGFFIAICYFLFYLERPSRRTLLAAGIAFGVAQALKFSLILLIPFMLGIALLWAFAHNHRHSWKAVLRAGWQWFLRTCAVFALGYALVIWPLYQFHVWNYPTGPADPALRAEIDAARGKWCPDLDVSRIPPSQYRDTVCNLKTFRPHALADLMAWAADKPVLRPFAQYATGAMMVSARTVGGNTTFFMGEVSREAWWSYFPVVYLVKEPLAMHALSLAALAILIGALMRKKRARHITTLISRSATFLRTYFVEVTMVLFVLLYWTASILANLNIGVRHLIPAFPFMFLVVSRIIIGYLRKKPDFHLELSFETIERVAAHWKRRIWQYGALTAVLLWYVISVSLQYPYFTAYFNALAGGPGNGHTIVADSNLDWGQDLKRLAAFVRENNIEHISVDYFGGGEPSYELGDRFAPWWSARGPAKGWFAVSATIRDGAFGELVGTQERSEADSYLWLRDKKPVTLIGHSIFVYKLD